MSAAGCSDCSTRAEQQASTEAQEGGEGESSRDCSTWAEQQAPTEAQEGGEGESSRDSSTRAEQQAYTEAQEGGEGESSRDSQTGEAMPVELIERILSNLPPLNLLRLRTVCKKWKSLLSSALFWENCSPAPLFLLCADQKCQSYPTYDPLSNSWYLMPKTSSVSSVVVASAGGLLCLSDTEESGELTLYVANPITKVRRQLPPMILVQRPYVVGMVMNSVEKTYKVLVARNGVSLELQVFDSITNSWGMAGSVQKRLALLVGEACFDGVLYCLQFGTSVGVAGYHVEKGTWEDLGVAMPSLIAWPQLFGSRGNLMLVGATAECGSLKNVCIWQLDKERMEWVEVFRVPDDLLLRLCGGHLGGLLGAHILFVADGDFVCFARYRSKQMLMCNFFKKAWWWLPPCPFDWGVCPNFSGFPLLPSLVASV